MRGVFLRTRRVAVACLLIAVLLAPSALASDTTTATSLWDQVVAWLASRLGVPGGVAATEEDQSRLGVPGG